MRLLFFLRRMLQGCYRQESIGLIAGEGSKMLFDREEIKKAWIELRATGGLRTVVGRKEQSGGVGRLERKVRRAVSITDKSYSGRERFRRRSLEPCSSNTVYSYHRY